MSDRASSDTEMKQIGPEPKKVKDTAKYGTGWLYCKKCVWTPTSCEHLEGEKYDDKGREIIRYEWDF